MTDNITTGKNGYISKRLFNTIVGVLDSRFINVQIVKTKRVKQYILYVNFKIYGKPRKTRAACKRTIWKIYKKVEECKPIEQPPAKCPAVGVIKKTMHLPVLPVRF